MDGHFEPKLQAKKQNEPEKEASTMHAQVVQAFRLPYPHKPLGKNKTPGAKSSKTSGIGNSKPMRARVSSRGMKRSQGGLSDWGGWM